MYITFVSVDLSNSFVRLLYKGKTFADVSAGTIVAVLQQATFQFLV
jgi:hypothetical protein